MNFVRFIILTIAFAIILISCEDTTKPERFGKITGKVRAQFLKTAASGAEFGLQYVGDNLMDSVYVHLFDSEGNNVAQVMAFDGIYTFDGLKEGYYTAQAIINTLITTDTIGVYVVGDNIEELAPLVFKVKDFEEGSSQESKVYPNPALTATIYQFYNPTVNNISVLLYNLKGTIISNVVTGTDMVAGTFSISMDFNEMGVPYGFYYLVLNRGTEISYKPLLYQSY